MVSPTRLYLEMIRTETLLYFRWEKGVSEQKGPEHNIKEAEKCKIWFPRNKHTQYLPASSPGLNHAGVLLVIPSPTSLKDPSGRRDKPGLELASFLVQQPSPHWELLNSVVKTYRISVNDSLKKN